MYQTFRQAGGFEDPQFEGGEENIVFLRDNDRYD